MATLSSILGSAYGSQGLAGSQGSAGNQGVQGLSNQGVQGGLSAQGAGGSQGFQGSQGGLGTQGVQGGLSAQGAAGTGLDIFTPLESTAAPNNTIPVESLTATNAGFADIDVALVAKGQGATLAQVPDSGTGGGNKRGIFATDWQKSRTANTQVASGSYSAIGGGQVNTASGTNSAIAGGSTNTASSTAAAVGGGGNNTANAAYSTIPGGRRGTARAIVGICVFPACSEPIASAAGVSQSGLLILGVQTTDATTTTLRSDTSAATTTNQLVLANNAASYVRGSVIANVTGAGNTKAWTFEGAIKRGANVAATSIVGTFSTNVIAADAGASTWTIALSADTTNGALQVQVTGQAATTIRWVCKLETTEVTY